MYIKDLAQVIESRIKQVSVVRYTCRKLLTTGENYGSVMLKVEVVIRNAKGDEETLNIVAKTPPPKGFIWELFTTPVTFKKEVGYYEQVLPAFKKFLDGRNLTHFINVIPQYYGSRVTLKPNSVVVDEDALLLLENLKAQGYEVGDRFSGFDLEAAKLIIDVMAEGHAVAVAFREAFPSEFDEIILPIVDLKYKIKLPEDYVYNIVKSYIDFLQPFDSDFKQYQERMIDSFFYRVEIYDRPHDNNIFNTVIHNDMWTNNMMVKTVNNRVTAVKLVDYQVTRYALGTNDLIFFLHTSVQLSVLKNHTDYLIRYYYDTFISALTKAKADTRRFTWETFNETIKPSSRMEFSHIAKLLCPIFTKKGKAKELENFSLQDFAPSLECVHENFAPRLEYIIYQFIRRDWL